MTTLNDYLAQIRKRVKELEKAAATLGPIRWRDRLDEAIGSCASRQEITALDYLADQQDADAQQAPTNAP